MFDRFVWSHVLDYERKQGISNHSSHAFLFASESPIQPELSSQSITRLVTSSAAPEPSRVPSSSIRIVDLGGERLFSI